MAAVMACGVEAVLSHRSAAALWGIASIAGTSIDVTAPKRRGRSPAGIDSHRDCSLHGMDRTSHRGIPCTSVSRTLLDLAGVVRERELQRAIAEAEVLGLFDLSTIQDVIKRGRGRRGVARLRLLVSDLDAQAGLTRSELERRFLALCHRAFLPAPEVNVSIPLGDGDVVADFVWRDARLIVETDGRQFHDTRSAFERDRRRDQRLGVSGWRVVRCTWRQVVVEPAELARAIHVFLSKSPCATGLKRPQEGRNQPIDDGLS